MHRSGSFWSFLLSIEKDLADSIRRQGPTPRRVHELATLFGVDRATVARWQAFWRDYIPQTPFWKLARGRLVPVVEIVVLPRKGQRIAAPISVAPISKVLSGYA